MFILSWLLNSLLVLLTVAFFTLFERKVMGLVHLRLGPNNASFSGLLQPLLDAFNLLSNQNLSSIRSNNTIYYSTPLLSLLSSILFWILLPQFYNTQSLTFSILAYLVLGSVIVLICLLSGWSSNSNYTFVGSLRSVAQSISYESVFTTLIITVCIVSQSYSILSSSVSISSLSFLLLPLWFFSLLAETHRAPFDFSESESELVSGYNTEYGGANFAILFLAEYSALLFGCAVTTYLFLPHFLSSNPIILAASIILLSYFVTIIRVSFCRFRYDNLIALAWNTLLPVSLSILLIQYIFYPN